MCKAQCRFSLWPCDLMILWKKVTALSANKLETLFLSIGSTTLERRVLVERELGYGASRRIIVTTYGSLHNYIYLFRAWFSFKPKLYQGYNKTRSLLRMPPSNLMSYCYVKKLICRIDHNLFRLKMYLRVSIGPIHCTIESLVVEWRLIRFVFASVSCFLHILYDWDWSEHLIFSWLPYLGTPPLARENFQLLARLGLTFCIWSHLQ